MKKKDYIEQLAEEAAANNGVVHIPHTPPKATTPEETDKLLQELKNHSNEHDYMSILDELSIYVSILNESNGALSPYIYKEIDARNAANPKNKTDFWKVLDGIAHKKPEAVEILEAARSELKQAKKIERAEKARESQRAANNEVEATPGKPIHYNKSANDTKLSTTKLTNEFFTPAPTFQEINGQIAIPNIAYITSEKKEAILSASFAVNRDLLKTFKIKSAALDYGYDYFVMSKLDQNFYEGNTEVTLTHLLNGLGIPVSQAEMQKLFESLVKGLAITTVVNNKQVLEAWNIETKNYKEIIGSIMPITIETERKKIDGQLSKMTIKINDYSPFYKVSEPLNQLQSWDNRLFTLYKGRRTPKYWRIMRYLCKEIAWMRNDGGKKKRSNSISIDSISAFVGDNTRKQKHNTKEMTWKILQECFVKCHYIEKDLIENNRTGAIELEPISNSRREKLLLAEQKKTAEN